MTVDFNFGPNGQAVYERTYSRPLPDGSKETWDQTVSRVARGNLELVYGPQEDWADSTWVEYDALYEHILNFKILPAGRHLWASGVKGRQYLMNCWTSGWGEKLSDHFEFTFLRLMEGGGVGANYSSNFLEPFGAPRRALRVHIVCDPDHPDYTEMLEMGVLSTEYVSDWEGAYEVADSREGWASALTDLIDTYMTDDQVKHSERVYDVTNVRCKGSRLKTFGGTASGPAPFAMMMHEVSCVLNDTASRFDIVTITPWDDSFNRQIGGPAHLSPLDAMEIDHAIAECVVSGGNRRSARMSIVRWSDPYIQHFLACKSDTGKHWTTNISVEVDDEFFTAMAAETHPSKPLAVLVHREVVTGMLTNGEPGYWNSSLSNRGELQPAYATNPCGEIVLQPWEACNLGHVNLDAFAPKATSDMWDEGALIRAHELVTRFLIRATYADINDPKSRVIQDQNRRIGVGHLGVQDFLVKNGWRYSDIAVSTRACGYHEFRELLKGLKQAVRNTARSYAFELRIPEPVKVTTVAPTGSISKLPGVGGEGIHPIYSRYYEQRMRFSDRDAGQVQSVKEYAAAGVVVEKDVYDESGSTSVVVFPTKNRLVQQVEDMGYDPSIVEQADELSLHQMLGFQAMYQNFYADNAVSYTANVPEGLDLNETMDIVKAWLPILKGTTIMVDGTRAQAPFTRITREEYEATQVQSLGDGIDEDCSTGSCPIR